MALTRLADIPNDPSIRTIRWDMLTRLSLIAAVAGVLAHAQPAPDLILRNGTVITLNERVPQAEAIAITGDRIVALGSSADLLRTAGPATRILDLGGRLAIPGLIEGHGHFSGIGEFRLSLNLREARTWDDIVAQVGRAAKQAKPGEWIVGRGWHQSKWSKPPTPNTDGFPLHIDLSKVSPLNPVVLRHASGHATFVNAAAMKAAGISKATQDPSGGHVMKDGTGNPTGLLQETAQNLVTGAYESWRAKRSVEEQRAEIRKAIDLATDECLAKGITSFQDAGSSFEFVDLLRNMADKNELRVRLWVMLRGSNTDLQANARKYRRYRRGQQHADRSCDQAFYRRGSRTAQPWLLEPYTDCQKALRTPPD